MAHCRRGKRKRLTTSDCWSLSNSSEGAFSLTQPLTYTGTSGDLNRGLYPRNRKDRKTATQLCPLQRHNTHRLSEDATGGKAIVGPLDFTFDPEDFLSNDLSAESDTLGLNSKSNREHCDLSLGCPNRIGDVGWDVCTKGPSLEDAAVTLQRSAMRDWVEDGDLEVDPLPDSYFGLLGCSSFHALPSGHISQLPDEILRAMFVHLPAVDLYRISLVCQQWRRVISDPMFVPQKKLYCQYRKGKESAVKEIDWILKRDNITKDDELCVLNLIKYVASFQPGRSVNSEAVLSCLQDHPRSKQSEACVSQRLPNLVKAAGTNVWAVLAVIILLSDCVKDIQRLISCLQRPRSTLPLTEVTEILYCMATLLFASRERDINISNRIHYNLFYALYLMENPANISGKHVKHLCSAKDSGRLEIHDIKPTPEQQQILNHETAAGHVIKIRGFAGTGKTSTLIKYARSRPLRRFLYIVSTKPVPVEIRHIVPPNVECTTMRAMAYRCIGYKYQHKKKLTVYGLQPLAIFRLPEGRGSFFRANLICRSLCTFFSSMDETITAAHVPEHCKSTRGDIGPMEYPEKLLVEDVKRIWRKMVDLGETKEAGYFMTHDGYLKLWQLSKPSLSQFDVILLDEAEDCSPAIMDIVLSQKCGKILVGDPHQQISSFKGTVDVLLEAHCTHLFSLTQSLRFGPKIAYVAATILDTCKHVKDKTLVGRNHNGDADDDTVGQVAMLCRTNAAVFDEAVRIITSDNPSKIYIIGGLDTFGMGTILDIWLLLILEKEQATRDIVIRDPFIRIFEREGGLRGLKEYAAEAEDKELEERIAVVEKYNLGLPSLIEKITNYSVDSPTFANIVLGTVHKAKGYEFDTVQITDDLVKVPGFRHDRRILSGFRMDMVPDVDWNLLYVAVTRARRRLVMNRSLECLLSFAGEYFLKPELTTSLFGEGMLPRCCIGGCLNHIESEAVLTMRKAPSTHSGEEDAGGPLCCECVKQRIGPLTYLLASRELVNSVGYSRENGL